MAAAITLGLRRRADAMSTRRLFLLVAVPLFVLFLLTSNRAVPYHIDAFSNVLPAWSLGTSGRVYLPDHVVLVEPDYFGNVPGWFLPGLVSQQASPGAALLAAPLYAMWPRRCCDLDRARLQSTRGGARRDPVPSFWPARSAAFSVALAAGFLAISFRPLAGGATALIAAYLAGLGTSAWSVAANELVAARPRHDVDRTGRSLGRQEPDRSRVCLWPCRDHRPLNAFIAGATGLYVAWQERSLWPAVQAGIGALAGLARYFAFNAIVFGEPSVLGGYAPVFVDNAQSLDLVGYGATSSWPSCHPLAGCWCGRRS